MFSRYPIQRSPSGAGGGAWWLSLIVSAALLFTGCTAAEDSGRPTVVAAVYPLAFIAEELAGAEAEVERLTPAGAEPHDLELTPGQARSIAEADLVLYVGAGFQPAVEDAVQQSGNGLDVLELVGNDLPEPGSTEHEDEGDAHSEESDEEEAEDQHGDDEHAGEHGADPHVWLDPTLAAAIAGSVAIELQDLLPGARDAIAGRANDLTQRLEELHDAFETSLASCEGDTIVVSHEAFGFLTGRYGLKQEGISGIDPEQEPSPQRLAEMARFVRDNEIGTIFLEPLVSREVGQTLADETGAGIAYLDPLEMPPADGDFFDAMRLNLDALRRGLKCDPGV